MADPQIVTSNTVIVYATLRQAFVDWIKTVADNISIEGKTIPAEFVKPFSMETPHVNLGYVTVTLTGSTADAEHGISTVSQSQITQDVDSFMSARGIDTKSNKPITTKGIIQFWNYAAIFCTARLARAISTVTTKTPLIYRSGTVSYATPGITDDNNYIVNADINNALTVLMDTINNYSKVISMVYSYAAHCCCCSSSSSSSCSSSVFIGYMKLPT